VGTAAASTVPVVPAGTLAGVKPFVVPGETITWQVSFAGVEGGRARLAIGQVGASVGRRLVVVRAEAETAGVAALLASTRDTIDSWIDVDSGLPARTESTSASTVIHAERVPGEPVARLDIYAPKYGADGLHKAQRLPAVETYDPLSAVLALRAWDAPPGSRVLVYSLGGARLWKNVFTIGGRDELDGPLGHRRTIRILGVSTRIAPTTLEDDRKAPPRTYTVWLSDDAQRIPIQIVAHTELGDITARATSYQRAE
jgi:hypothetical protein